MKCSIKGFNSEFDCESQVASVPLHQTLLRADRSHHLAELLGLSFVRLLFLVVLASVCVFVQDGQRLSACVLVRVDAVVAKRFVLDLSRKALESPDIVKT